MSTLDIRTFMEGIELSKEGIQQVLNYAMSEDEYLQWKHQFYNDKNSFFDRLDSVEEKEKLVLYLYVRLGIEAYNVYRNKHISDEIYFDTMKDITIWYNDCLKKKGICGLTQERWLSLHIEGKIVRLGRLQFEPERDVIHVHIPEGEPLSVELCNQAFAIAEDFFDKSYVKYDCKSWLLSPELKTICRENSNIIQFQKRFKIEKVTHHFRQAEERVYGEVETFITQYPEDTSLQKSLKKYLLTGREPGMGYGIIER